MNQNRLIYNKLGYLTKSELEITYSTAIAFACCGRVYKLRHRIVKFFCKIILFLNRPIFLNEWPIPTANMRYYYYAFVIVMINSSKFAWNPFNLNNNLS